MKPDTPTRNPRHAPIFDRTPVTTHKSIEVIEFRPLRKGESLRGFVSLELPSSLVLHDCSYHQRSNGTRWIGLPSRPYKKPDGSSSWARLVDFSDRAAYERFQAAALEALDRYFDSTGESKQEAEVRKPSVVTSKVEITDDDISF